MATIAWRALPITSLTIRQFVGGKAVRVVIALSAIPVVFALIYLLNPDIQDGRDFLVDVVFRNTYLSTVLPISVLILATGALGNEIEDRTLPYLTLKPTSRLRIVVEKLIGTVVVCIPIIFLALALTFAIVFRGAWRDNLSVLWAMWAAVGAGTVAYAAIFQFVSLLISRALLAGIVYSLIWESLLGRYIAGIRYVSIRHYTESIFVNVLDDPLYTLKNAVGWQAAVITIVVTTLFCIVLGTWRLSRMNQE